MKNAINYYYNLIPNEIHQQNQVYRFTSQNQSYVIMPYLLEQDVKKIYDLSMELINRGIYTHQIIPNKDGQLVTLINNIPYLLMKYYDSLERNVKLEDLIAFQNATKSISLVEEEILWNHLWSQKIDYFEYQVSQFGKKYPLIRESFSFYVGIAETGITLAANIKGQSKQITHRRLKVDSTYFDLYNPLNYVLDLKVRDISEYFKNLFLSEKNLFPEIVNYLQNAYLSSEEYYAFFVRMFYPSFYFDIFEKVIEGEEDEESLLKVIYKGDEYIEVLRNIYRFLSLYIPLPAIEWLNS